MKQLLILLVFASCTAVAMEQDQYVCARERWLGNDHMPHIFMSLLVANKASHGVFSSKNSDQPLVEINLDNGSVTTFFSQDGEKKQLTHTFGNFTNFINDRQLVARAKKYRSLKKNLEIKCVIL